MAAREVVLHLVVDTEKDDGKVADMVFDILINQGLPDYSYPMEVIGIEICEEHPQHN